MRKVIAATLALALSSPAAAGSFGIDFSPLSEPGFGKRRDYGVGDPVDISGGQEARPSRPPRPSPEMRGLGRELDDAQARLSRDIIEIPSASLPMPRYDEVRRQTDLGDVMFNVREDDWTIFDQLPENYHPPLTVAGEALAAAAQLAIFADQGDPGCEDALNAVELSCENRAFLAGQAAIAMEGIGSLRVSLPVRSRPVTGEDRAAADRAMGEWGAALNAVSSARLERRTAEALVLANPVDLTNYEGEERERIKLEMAERYYEALRQERLAGERLRGAQLQLLETVARAGR